jgi:AraC-like DNA-binding protein
MVKRLTNSETQEYIDASGIEASPLESFAYLDSADGITYDWHSHSRHQLLYAFSGTLRVEADSGLYLLPPQRAMWIPAGVMHRTTLNKVHSGSVFFHPELVPTTINEVRIISVAPIVREMVLFAMRWPVNRDCNDAIANSFFKTFGLLCSGWLEEEMPFRLPASQSKQIAAAMEYTLENLESATVEEAAKAAALSPRHFRRRFAEETGIVWRQFRLHARILRAMELLTEPHANITNVAYSVGFNSLSAFAKSFALIARETPSAYRERVKG